MPLYLEAPPIMLALPFHHAALYDLDSPQHPASAAAIRAAALPDSLVSLALRSLLSGMDTGNALRAWIYGSSLPQPFRGIVFAAVISFAAPICHRLPSLPGWQMMDDGSKLTLITVGGAVALFSGASSARGFTPGHSVAEFCAVVKEAREELHERLVEAEARQRTAEAEAETVRATEATQNGWWRLSPLCHPREARAAPASRGVRHGRAGIETSRERLVAIDSFLEQLLEASKSEHVWQLERAFTMMGESTHRRH